MHEAIDQLLTTLYDPEIKRRMETFLRTANVDQLHSEDIRRLDHAIITAHRAGHPLDVAKVRHYLTRAGWNPTEVQLVHQHIEIGHDILDAERTLNE